MVSVDVSEVGEVKEWDCFKKEFEVGMTLKHHFGEDKVKEVLTSTSVKKRRLKKGSELNTKKKDTSKSSPMEKKRRVELVTVT